MYLNGVGFPSCNHSLNRMREQAVISIQKNDDLPTAR
jgi:hypothetical protein